MTLTQAEINAMREAAMATYANGKKEEDTSVSDNTNRKEDTTVSETISPTTNQEQAAATLMASVPRPDHTVYPFAMDEVEWYLQRPNRVGFSQSVAKQLAAKKAKARGEFISPSQFTAMQSVLSAPLSSKQHNWMGLHHVVVEDVTNTQWFYEVCLTKHAEFIAVRSCGLCHKSTTPKVDDLAVAVDAFLADVVVPSRRRFWNRKK